jgi:hypothetical protein
MLLSVKYPENYPDEPPILDLLAPQNGPQNDLFSVPEHKDALLQGLDATIEENLGMAMVFTLVSSLKEAAEQVIMDGKQAEEKAREEAALAAEREENKKFHGTPVTPETFIKWRADFLKEMEELRQKEEEERLAELKKARIKEPVKLSGRQLWERGLAGKADAEEGDEDDTPADGIEKLTVEES